MTRYLTVSNLSQYLKRKFERDPYLERVYVTGQVSNFRKRPGHQYFSLKDDRSLLQATIWSGVYQHLGFDLEEGMQLNVVGRIQLYEPGGSYSLIVERAEPDGVGALAVKFEQLKTQLAKEGLFQDHFKQELPRFVCKIGVVTSQSGAVIQDIITTVSRRFPGVEILLFPTKVQGEGAAAELVATIRKANERSDLDVLIVGRGGGSIEDLWAFNEEPVVRAIFESRLPVISSVGHETDTTLADFVADKRAATPTAAAELATPVTKADVLRHLQEQESRLSQAMGNRLKFLRERLERQTQSVIFRQPDRLYDGYLQSVDRLSQRLESQLKERLAASKQALLLTSSRLQQTALEQRIAVYRERLDQQVRLLKSNMANCYDQKVARADKAIEALTMLDTSRIVARGYAIIEQEGRVLDCVNKINPEKEVTIQMRDGRAIVEVKHVQTDKDI